MFLKLVSRPTFLKAEKLAVRYLIKLSSLSLRCLHNFRSSWTHQPNSFNWTIGWIFAVLLRFDPCLPCWYDHDQHDGIVIIQFQLVVYNELSSSCLLFRQFPTEASMVWVCYSKSGIISIATKTSIVFTSSSLPGSPSYCPSWSYISSGSSFVKIV